MKKVAFLFIAGLFIGFAVSGCAEHRTVSADSLMFDASTRWTAEYPEHPSRRLQFRVPSRHAGYEDATLVVWNFASMRDPGDGSIIRENIARWCQKFTQGDGTPSEQIASIAEYRVNGLPVHTVDISGRYVAKIRPSSRMTHNKAAYRMLGAYIVSPDGDYIVQMVGPQPVVAANTRTFDEFIMSVRMGGATFAPNYRAASHRPRAQLTANRP